MKNKIFWLLPLLVFAIFLLGAQLGLAQTNITYTGFSFSVSSQAATPRGFGWNGTYLFVQDTATAYVYEYYLNGTYTGISDSHSTVNRGIEWDGASYLYVGYSGSGYVDQWYSNGTYIQSFDVSTQGSNPLGVAWDGTNFWTADNGNSYLFKYYSNWEYTGTSYDISANMPTPRAMDWDGTYLWLINVNQIAKAYYTNGTYSGENFSCASQDSSPRGLTYDGTYYWVLGGTNKVVYQYVDNAPPTITINSPTNTTYETSSIWFNATTNKPASWCGYSLNSNGNVTMSNSSTINWYNQNTSVADGYYNVTFYCNNTNGNVGSTSTLYFTVSEVPTLTVTLNAPADAITLNDTQTALFNFTAVSNTNTTFNCSIYLNSTLNQTNSSVSNNILTNFNISGMSWGSHSWYVNCTDSATSNVSATRIFTLVNTTPIVTIALPQNATYNNTIAVNYTATSNGTISACWYSLDGNSNISLGGCANTTLTLTSDGSHNITIYANSTNAITSYSQQWFSVNTTPIVTIISPQNITYNTNTVLLNVTATTNGTIDKIWYSLDGDANTSYHSNWTYSGTSFSVNGTVSLPLSMAYDGAYFYILDGSSSIPYVYKYYINGTYTGTSFDVTNQSNTLRGITWDGTYFWITSDVELEGYIYKYYANGTYTGFNFSMAGSSPPNFPRSLTYDGTYLWVVNSAHLEVYAYYTNGTYTGTSFDVSSQTSTPRGIAWDSTYLYVVGRDEQKAFKYYSNGTYTGTYFDISSSGSQPQGLVWDGTYFWNIGSVNLAVYKYSDDLITTDGAHNVTVYANSTTGAIGSATQWFTTSTGANCSVAIGLSTTLANNITYTINTLPSVNTTANGNNGSGVTAYNLTISASGCNADVYIKASGNLISGGNNIGLGNETFKYNTTDNTLASSDTLALTTSFQKIATNLTNGDYTYLKFFLSVPSAQPSGQYLNNISIEGVKTGDSPV